MSGLVEEDVICVEAAYRVRLIRQGTHDAIVLESLDALAILNELEFDGKGLQESLDVLGHEEDALPLARGDDETIAARQRLAQRLEGEDRADAGPSGLVDDRALRYAVEELDLIGIRRANDLREPGLLVLVHLLVSNASFSSSHLFRTSSVLTSTLTCWATWTTF